MLEWFLKTRMLPLIMKCQNETIDAQDEGDLLVHLDLYWLCVFF